MKCLLHYHIITINNHKKRVVDLTQKTDYYAYGTPHGDSYNVEANVIRVEPISTQNAEHFGWLLGRFTTNITSRLFRLDKSIKKAIYELIP